VEAVVIAGRRFIVTAAALAGLAACSPRPPCGLRQCDIRQADCQHDVVQAAACLRGQPAADFPVTVKPQAAYIAEAEMEAAAVSDAERESFRVWQQALSLFRLGDPKVSITDSAKEQAAWVAAYYDPATKAVTVIDADRPLDSARAVTLLVHEATHALQDRSVGLEAFRGKFSNDLDRMLASKAVTEGEASLIEDLAAVGLFTGDEQDVHWAEVFDRWQDLARDQALRTPVPVYLSWGHFPYPWGTPYVLAAYRTAGRAGLDRLYQEPPASAAQVMAGFGAVPAAGGVWSEELIDVAAPRPPAPWTYFDGDRLGAWVWSVFIDRVSRAAPPGDLRPLYRARIALRADRFTILREPTSGGVLAAWRLRLDSAGLAAEVAAALTGLGLALQAIALDRDVVLLAGSWPVPPDQLSFGPVPAMASMHTAVAGAARERCIRRP
jgi:hypothetical protein